MSLVTEHLQRVLDRKLPAALVAGMLLIGAPVYAADYLEPVLPMASHDEFVRYVFADAFSSDVLVRVYIDRSWYPPDMAGIRKDRGAYRIFVLRAPANLPKMPENPSFEPFAVAGPGDAKTTIAPVRSKPTPVRDMKRCSIALDKTLAGRIENAWTRMVLGTRTSPNPRLGADGVSYTFWTTSPQRSGWICSPQPNTAPGTLAQIAESMVDYCESRKRKDLTGLMTQVGLLEKRLK
jgi:hypothetical protein